MRFTRTVALAGALLLAALTAGCGAGSGGTNTLTYWATNEANSIDVDRKIYNRIIKEFENKHGVDVKIQVIPWADLYDKVLRATTKGSVDVVNIGNTWSTSLRATGAFVPFEGETMTAIGGRNKFVPTAMKSAGPPGKAPTAVPLYLLTDPVLFYNKKLLAEAGIEEPPNTWREFMTAAKKLTKDTDGDGKTDQWGIAFPGTDFFTMVHRTYVLSQQMGGHFFTSSGEPEFAAPKNVRAAKRIVDLVQRGVAPKAVAEYQGSDAISDFADGRAAMLLDPLVSAKPLEKRGMTGDDYGVALRPVPADIPPGGKPYRGYLSGTNISVFKSSDNKDLALEFVRFMTSKKQQVALANAYGDGYLPVTRKAWNSSGYGGEHLELAKRATKNTVAMPQVVEEADMETFVGNAVVRLVRQASAGNRVTTADVRAALRKANEKMKVTG